MAMEFPSRMAAAGFVEGTGTPFNANARGCVVTRTGAGDYLITLDRGIAPNWATLNVNPAGNPIALVLLSIIAQLTDTQFQVAGEGDQPIDFDFYFTIHAIDESQ